MMFWAWNSNIRYMINPYIYTGLHVRIKLASKEIYNSESFHCLHIYCDFDLICNYALAMQRRRKQLLSSSWLYKLHTCVGPQNNESSHGDIMEANISDTFAWNGKGNGTTFDICNIFLARNHYANLNWQEIS